MPQLYRGSFAADFAMGFSLEDLNPYSVTSAGAEHQIPGFLCPCAYCVNSSDRVLLLTGIMGVNNTQT